MLKEPILVKTMLFLLASQSLPRCSFLQLSTTLLSSSPSLKKREKNHCKHFP